MQRFVERKEASGVDMDGGNVSNEEEARRVLSGLDLDMDELMDGRTQVTQAAYETLLAAINKGDDVQRMLLLTLASIWVDGVAVGVMVEKARP